MQDSRYFGQGFDFDENNNYEPINDFYNINKNISETNINFDILNDDKKVMKILYLIKILYLLIK